MTLVAHEEAPEPYEKHSMGLARCRLDGPRPVDSGGALVSKEPTLHFFDHSLLWSVKLGGLLDALCSHPIRGTSSAICPSRFSALFVYMVLL